MLIDAYSHACPSSFLDAVMNEFPSLEAEDLTNSYLWDGDERLRYLDRVGFDRQVLTMVRPPMWLGMPNDVQVKLTRVANEGLAAMAEQHPDRYTSVGVMPTVNEEMMGEFDFLRTELGLKGVMIFTNINGLPLDHESMWPLYEEAARHDMPIWIHPQHSMVHPWVKGHRLERLFSWPFETSLAMGSLVSGGVMERFPNLKFITHHAGGMTSFFAGRIAGHDLDYDLGEDGSVAAVQTHTVVERSKTAAQYQAFYGDTMVGGWTPALQCGLDFFGVSHLVFGTDFPMGRYRGERTPPTILDSVHRLGLEEADLDAVLGGNIKRLLGE
jgi:predicted TIM-barrel fold metal-dependent hydrolase